MFKGIFKKRTFRKRTLKANVRKVGKNAVFTGKRRLLCLFYCSTPMLKNTEMNTGKYRCAARERRAGSRTRHKPHIAYFILLPYKIPFEWFYRSYGAAGRKEKTAAIISPAWQQSFGVVLHGLGGQLFPFVSRSIVSLIARTTKALVLSPMLAACS